MFIIYIFELILVLIFIACVICCYSFYKRLVNLVNGAQETLDIIQQTNGANGRRVQRTSEENEDRTTNEIQSEYEDSKETSLNDFKTCCGDDLNELNIVRNFVNEEELCLNMKNHRTLPGMFKYINDNICKWDQQKFFVAIIGRSGAGKSSLINTLRGLKPTDDGGAAVGETETTSVPKEYRYPDNDKVILLEVPGMDTQSFPITKYLKQIGYKRIDLFIVVVSFRICDSDISLAKQLTEYKKHVMVVRTKIDADIESAKRNNPNVFSAERKLHEVKEELKSNLRRAMPDLDKYCFLISSFYPNNFEFPLLEEMLGSFLKRRGILISKLIYVVVKNDILKKKTTCQNSFRFKKGLCFLYAFLYKADQLYLVNKSIAEIHKTCSETFCLDDNSLDNIEVKALLRTQEKHETIKECSLKRFCMKLKTPEFPLQKLRVFVSNCFYVSRNTQNMCDAMSACELYLVEKRLMKLIQQLGYSPHCEIVSNQTNTQQTDVKMFDTDSSFMSTRLVHRTQM